MPQFVVASSCVHDNAVNRSAPNLRGHAVGIQRIGTVQSGSWPLTSVKGMSGDQPERPSGRVL